MTTSTEALVIAARLARYWRVLAALLPARVDRAHAQTNSQAEQVFSSRGGTERP
jgi:hypothetical protein